MPDTTVKLQDITPVKSTFDSDDQLLLINATGEARISKADFATELGYTANSKAPVITDTASGAIANFPDGADNIPVADLVVDIEPQQNLNGYSNPWPAGGGKNLYSILIGADTFQINVGATFSNVDGTLKIEMTSGTSSGVYATSLSVIKPLIMSLSGEYTLSFDIKASQSGAVICGTESLTSTPITATTSWQRFSFTNTYATPNTTFVCYNRSGNAMTVEIKNLQICLSSATDPTVYAPYSNICPITGWTGCNVTRTGANVWDEEYQFGYYDANGTFHARTTYGEIASKNMIPVLPNTTYYFHIGSSVNRYVCYYDANSDIISQVGLGSTDTTFTTPSNCHGINFNAGANYGTTYNNDISINYPSTDTQYHPYQGTTLAIDWTTEAGTVYGGTLDATTGVLTVDRAMVDAGTLSWNYSGDSVNHRFSANMPSDYKQPTSAADRANIICSRYAANPSVVATTTALGISGYQGGSTMFIRDLAFSDNPSFNAAMSGVQIVYYLATPQTYQLTPQQLNTLLGTNNIYSDCSSVEVEYRADTKLFIEKLTMPTEDDMVANQAITSGKYFMIGNSLYLALANIANGAQITIGTNAQRVSLADALNAINS